MFDFMLYTPNPDITFGEKMLLGGQVTLLGMGTVFSVLVLLWGLVELLHLLLAPKKSKALPEKAPETVIPETASETDDREIVAAITAAIAAATGRAPSSFRVVSFKRANNKFSK